MFAQGSTVTRLREVSGATTDRYGQHVTTTNSLTITGVAIRPAVGDEIEDAKRQGVKIELMLICPFDVDIKERDRVVIDNETFRVPTRPQRWRSPHTGREVGCMVSLEAVTG